MLDIIIENGRIIDGTGNPWFKGDIGIKNGRIERIGQLKKSSATERIDVDGLVVSPGFIDIHSHSDAMPFMYPQDKSKLMQGVTTEVVGNCGVSIAPVSSEYDDLLKKYSSPFFAVADLKWDWQGVKDYLDKVEEIKPIVNVAFFVGHGSIRIAVMGFDDREPTADELDKMKELALKAIEEGAFGLSSGLIYPPGIFAQPQELIELCKVVATEGGIYSTHMRSETDGVIEAVEEAIDVAEKANIPVQIVHHKVAGPRNWGKSDITLQLIDDARNRGLDITCDVYPYVAASTSLPALLPPWMQEGGVKKLLERLSKHEIRERIKQELETGLPGWQNFYKASGWDKIIISSLRKNKSYEGKSILEIAQSRKVEPAEVMFDLLVEEDGDVMMVLYMMSEDEVTKILQHPAVMVGSDGLYSPGKPHPRYYGTFPRVLAKYVRQDKALSVTEAVRKMTSQPAQRLGLADRGLLKAGMWADIVVFDPITIQDKATYMEPQQYPVGIEYVLLNGEVAVRKGEYTGTLAGKVLRK